MKAFGVSLEYNLLGFLEERLIFWILHDTIAQNVLKIRSRYEDDLRVATVS